MQNLVLIESPDPAENKNREYERLVVEREARLKEGEPASCVTDLFLEEAARLVHNLLMSLSWISRRLIKSRGSGLKKNNQEHSNLKDIILGIGTSIAGNISVPGGD